MAGVAGAWTRPNRRTANESGVLNNLVMLAWRGVAARKRSETPVGPEPVESSGKPLFEDLLRGIRLRSCVHSLSEARAPWGVSIAKGSTFFHIVYQGECWLQLKGAREPIQLGAGDFVVVTQGLPHTMRDQPSTPVVDYFELLKTSAPVGDGVLCFGGNGVVTRLVCGGMLFENHDSNPLLAILPPLLCVKGTKGGAQSWLGLTVEHLLSELDRGGRAGAEEVVTRLAEIVFIQAVRAHFEENVETANSGFLAAVRDPQIGEALAILHRQPHRPWTVISLARRLAMSRSAFAARFTELVGEPPQRYVTRLRIDAAAERLRTSGDHLSTVAATAGYKSVAAFVKSFKRHTGMTPGEYRNSSGRCSPLI